LRTFSNPVRKNKEPKFILYTLDIDSKNAYTKQKYRRTFKILANYDDVLKWVTHTTPKMCILDKTDHCDFNDIFS